LYQCDGNGQDIRRHVAPDRFHISPQAENSYAQVYTRAFRKATSLLFHLIPVHSVPFRSPFEVTRCRRYASGASRAGKAGH
jgi:hypothetical protein